MDRAALSQLSKDDLIALLLAQEARIAELERQLAAKEQEKYDLIRANFQLAKKALVRSAFQINSCLKPNTRRMGRNVNRVSSDPAALARVMRPA